MFSVYPAWRLFFSVPWTCPRAGGHFNQWEGPGVAEDILRMIRLAADRNIDVGVVATGLEDARRRQTQGFRMIALGTDTDMMIRPIKALIDGLKG